MTSINLSLLSASITSYNSAVHDEALTMCFIRKFKRKRLNLLTDTKEKRWVLLLLLLSFPRAVRAMACANHSLISSCFSSAYVEILSTWEVWRALKHFYAFFVLQIKLPMCSISWHTHTDAWTNCWYKPVLNRNSAKKVLFFFIKDLHVLLDQAKNGQF